MVRAYRAIIIVGNASGEGQGPASQPGLVEPYLLKNAAVTYEVVNSRHPHRILQRCQAQAVDVVVLEIADPSDLELLAMLRQQLGDGCPPVVVVGDEVAALIIKAFKLGAADYLLKDQVTPEALVLSLQAALAVGQVPTAPAQPASAHPPQPEASKVLFQNDTDTTAAQPWDVGQTFASLAHYRYRGVDHTLAEAMPQMVWTADATGIIDYWNHRWCDYTGLSAVESRHWGEVEVLHPADRDRTLQLWRRSVTLGEPFESKNRIRRHDGTYHWFINQATPIRDRQNQITGWTGTLVNIDRQKQLEERFRLVTRAVDGLVFDWDLSTNSVYRSEKLYELVGVHPANALPTAEWWRDRIHPDDIARLQPQLEAMFNSASGLYDSEYRVRHADGRWVDVWERGCLVRDERGQVVRIVGSTVDISDRKRAEADRRRAEAALADNESRLQSFVNANVVGILYGDADGYIYKANDELLRIIGYSRAELETRQIHWAAITPPESLPLDEYAIAESRQKGACTPYEKEYIRKDGTRVPVLIGYSQVGATKEETIAFVLDLSALKAVEAEREQLLRREQLAREEAERANRVKDEFLTILSHELRTPLNPILGWAKLLQTRQLGEAKTALALSTIERNARLQAQLVDDLLDIAKILRGKLKLETTPVNLNAVVAAAIDTVKPAAIAKQIALRFTVQGVDASPEHLTGAEKQGLIFRVAGDKTRLHQIVWNLLSNAIKFTPEGGQVGVQLKQRDRQVQVIVKDSGKGIKPEFLPLLFESFRQEDISITRQHGGLGLGLSIVRHLVEAHGGTVTADSPGEGLGATFTLSLPVLKAHASDHQPSVPPPPAPDLNAIRVLIVDDHADTLELLATLLTQYGATVLAVNSAAEAMEGLESFQPDVIVSDIGMPGTSGHTLIQSIRTLPAEKGGQVAALAFTSYCQDDDYQQTLASGYQRLIAKPLEIEQLIKAIAELAQSV
ncbi:PAS domain-containing protein [Nodosilinea sp. LEGE 06152]|uniref:PAS domain-containing protein n=1 Tax=Nodosilinea sp. LEGE 06152 TaxID=2777966 RepID=UPI00187FA760|nr:PAS domain-containing protein [Nodosilinea sp. LEGE 06152]MBE9158065.1 PAS domain-containing protein [Nodosilinea sp. LEGE 06152]